MPETRSREHFIPLRKGDLIDLLCADLAPADGDAFRQLSRLLAAAVHFEYHQVKEKLQNAYASFDPDADTHTVMALSPEESQKRLDDLFARFTWLMERANFRRLHRDELHTALEEASYWGINMDVDFDVFERLEVFARGDILGKRSRRSLLKFWRLQEVRLPTYQRLVLMFKLRPHKRLGRYVDTDDVLLKLFKDIPKIDVEMLLPGARPKMPRFDQGKLSASLLSSIGLVGYKLAADLGHLAWGFIQKNPLALWGPLSLLFGYGYRQVYGYQQTRKSYSLLLTQSLYYQNLDKNSGVLARLLDEAEEQECREAILAYYFLWRSGPDKCGNPGKLDEHVEHELERRAGLQVNFEIDDALAKLERLGLVDKSGDRYEARPLAAALERLDWTLDNQFKYNTP